MRRLLIAIILVTTWPAWADERPTYDQIVRQFEAISFSSEYGGERRRGYLVRWEGPVRIAPSGVPSDDLSRVVDDTKALTGLDILVVDRGQPRNILISYGAVCEFDGRGMPVKISINPDRMHRCLYAELFQAVGPENDACHYRPSLFCDGEANETPAWADRVIMKATFDPRLRDMMPKAEAMPIARVIIRELYDAWERGERF